MRRRICPLEFLSGWTGRLSPGDVAFVAKYPPGFLSKNPAGAGTNGTATMSRVIGIDGVNRLLHGQANPDGWVAGDNVLVVDANNGSPMDVLSDEQIGSFKGLSTLEALRLDGIIKSNDEPYAFTSSGSRDAVVFNTVIQGPTVCNNGFLMYDPRGNPGYAISHDPRDDENDDYDSDEDKDYAKTSTGGATPLRTVESYARGSVEGGYHIGGAGAGYGSGGGGGGIVGNQVLQSGVPGRVGSSWLSGTGQYDYVASFTGTYSTYPAQMFDRNVEPMNTIYLGLRAWKLSDSKKRLVKADADSAPGSANLGDDKDAYFFQVMPFSSRKAYLCQHVKDEVEKAIAKTRNRLIENELNAALAAEGLNIKTAPADWLENKSADILANIATNDPARSQQIANDLKATADAVKAGVNATTASHKRGEKKSRFDDDIFDAVRTRDLKNMVGAWSVGRVLDIKAMRHTTYEGGPSDSSFALMVDVQTCWRNAKPMPGGTASDGNARRGYVEYGTNGIDRNGFKIDTRSGESQNAAKDQLAVDVCNAQFPSMQSSVGTLFGSKLGPKASVSAPASTGVVARVVDAVVDGAKKVAGAAAGAASAAAKGAKKAAAEAAGALAQAASDAAAQRAREANDDVNDPSDPRFFEAPADNQSAVASKTMPAAASPFVPTPTPATTTGAAGPSSSVVMSPAAAAASPVVAAAMAAAATGAKPGIATRAAPPRAKSPARSTGARTGAKAATATTAPAATTPVAASASAPAALASVSATPAGPAAGGADLSSAAAAPRRRERSDGQPTSTVSAVFDSIFGSADAPGAGDAPASPTPSSGSETSGPKTFRRPR